MVIAALFTLFLLIALAALRFWATHDRFTAKSRPSWFD